MPDTKEKPLLLLVDGHSLAFSSFYAFSKGGDGGLATRMAAPPASPMAFSRHYWITARG